MAQASRLRVNRASCPAALPTLAAGRRPNPHARRPRYVLVGSPARAQTRPPSAVLLRRTGNPSEVRNPASKSALRHPTNATRPFRLVHCIRNREDA
jgi:hypothetical protein